MLFQWKFCCTHRCFTKLGLPSHIYIVYISIWNWSSWYWCLQSTESNSFSHTRHYDLRCFIINNYIIPMINFTLVFQISFFLARVILTTRMLEYNPRQYNPSHPWHYDSRCFIINNYIIPMINLTLVFHISFFLARVILTTNARI